MTLDPRLLRSFVVLAEELHFGRASERLHLAQPALSQQIHRLEKQVGSSLYTRTSRFVELTESGQAMLAPARAAIRAAEQAERAAREASRTAAHPLRVGVHLDREDVVPILVAYASDHPEVQLSVARMHEKQGHEILYAGLLDVFVGGAFAAPDDSEVSRTRTIELLLYAVVGPDHPVAKRSVVSISAYRESTIAMFTRDYSPEEFDYYVDVLSGGHGRPMLSIREFRPAGDGSQANILSEIAGGHAVGLGTLASLTPAAQHLRLLPFDPPISVPTYVFWHPQRSQIVDAFVEHMSAL